MAGLFCIPAVQTYAAGKVTGFLSSKWKNSKIEIKAIVITPNFRVKAKEICIFDHKDQPMIYVEEFLASISGFRASVKQLSLNRGIAKNARISLITYPGDSLVNIKIFANIFERDPNDESFKLKINQVEIQQSYLVIRNENLMRLENPDGTVDYRNLELTDIYIAGQNFSLANKDINLDIDFLSFQQYTGFKMLDLSGHFRIYHGGMSLHDFKIKTPYSTLYGNIDFIHKNDYQSYQNFKEHIVLSFNFKPSSMVSLKDAAYFVPALKGMTDVLKISGNIDGTLADMRGTSLQIAYADHTELNVDFSIQNLQQRENLAFSFKTHDSQVDMREVGKFVLPAGKSFKMPENIAGLGIIRPDIELTGTLDRFTLRSHLRTFAGNLNTDILLSKQNGTYDYQGLVGAQKLYLGRLIKLPQEIGSVSFSGKVNGSGFNAEQINFNLDAQIATLEIASYPIRNTCIEGNYVSKRFEGQIHARDTNCNFNFKGILDFSQEIPNAQFYASVKALNLSEIFKNASVDSSSNGFFNSLANYAQKDTNVCFTADSMSVVFNGIKFEDFSGLLFVDKFTHSIGSYNFEMSRLRLNVMDMGDAKKIRLLSDHIDGIVTTDIRFGKIPQVFKEFLAQYLPAVFPIESQKKRLNDGGDNFINFELTLKNTAFLTNFTNPYFYIEEGGSIKGVFNAKDTNRLFEIHLPKIALSENLIIKGIDIKGNNSARNAFAVNFSCDTIEIQGKKRNSYFKKIAIECRIRNNRIRYKSRFDLPRFLSQKTSNLDGYVEFKSKNHIQGHFAPSLISVLAHDWTFSKNNAFEITPAYWKFDSLSLESNIHKITVDGTFSNNEGERVTVLLQEIDLAQINPYLTQSGITFDGMLTSRFTSSIRTGRRITLGSAYISDLVFNQQNFGNVFFQSTPLKDDQMNFFGSIFKSAQTLTSEQKLSFKPSDLSHIPESDRKANILGNYSVKENKAVFQVGIIDLGVEFLQPFLRSFSHKVGGNAAGKLNITLSRDSSYFKGEVNLKNGELGIAYLNTVYNITNQKIIFDYDGIEFVDVALTDPRQNTGYLNGRIDHRLFKNFKINLTAGFKNLLALNTTKRENEYFYGTGYATGKVVITGNTEIINISGIGLKTEHGSKLYLPMTFSEQASDNTFITYKAPPVTTTSRRNQSFVKPSAILNIDLNFDITPDAVIQMDLDPAIGGTLVAETGGSLRIRYNTLSNLEIFGGLTIENGVFNLALRDLFTRKFTLIPGGNINFPGNINLATLSLQASLRTTTSLANLNLTRVPVGRVPVEAFVKLNGNLMSPDIDFNFDLPNSPMDTKSEFFASVDTTNIQNRFTQFFSLMVLGSFNINQEDSGQDLDKMATMATRGAANSATELLNSTINNFLSRQAKYVEFGVNIRPTDLTDNTIPEQYSLLIHSSLLNDRLIIDGNFGYQGDPSSSVTNSTNFIGDVSLEYKLNPEGSWSVKIFNATNQYMDMLSNSKPYAQGVSLIYKKEFDTKDDFKKATLPRRKSLKKDSKITKR